MNTRLQKIIQLLMSANEPMTSGRLSANLHVSSKTIRNDIKELNRLLQTRELQIDSYRGKGYQLTGDEVALRKRLQAFVEEVKEVLPNEPDSRAHYLMERLLFQSNYVKMEDLADELYISRSTLQGDLKVVREILENYKLSLDQRPNYGIKVIGKETQIRFCISEYIFNQQPILMEDITDWLTILSKSDLEIIKNSILTKLRKYKIIISDISLQNLITHLAIACKRIRESNAVEIVYEELCDMKDKKEFLVAEEIVQDIEADLGVCFSENEVAYLAIHLQGTKLIHTHYEKEHMKSVMDKDIYLLTKEIVKRIDEKYNFSLSGDDELLLALSLHLKPAINRFKNQMNIRNPMLEEIKANYPLSFEAALISVDVLYEKLTIEIDENEIGYLALHIEVAQERLKRSASNTRRCLIVCATGLGSAQLLLYKLKDKFGDNLDVIGTTEYYNLIHQPLTNVDFIVSTIPIDKDLAVPVVYVSTILGDSDINKINKVMLQDTSVIERYIDAYYTFLNRDFETPEEVIRFLGDKLKKDGKVGKDYIDSVLERERYAPTSFGNLVAIPHPLEPKTDSTFWSIVTLNKPIQWGDKPVQIIFLLNTNKAKKEELKPMFNTLVKLLDSKDILIQLLQCKSYGEFRNIIKRS